MEMSASWMISDPLASPGPFFFNRTVFGLSVCSARRSPFTLRMIDVTSSVTPGIVENSCRTPSILTVVTAAPVSDESKTRRSALPTVVPKPRSYASVLNRPNVAEAVSLSTSTRIGIWKSFIALIMSPPSSC